MWQLVEILVDLGVLDKVIEVVKWATMYGNDKGGSNSNKKENKNEKG